MQYHGKIIWKKSLIGKNSDPLKTLHPIKRKKATENPRVEDACNIFKELILEIAEELTVL
jgi:hypothetical protein